MNKSLFSIIAILLIALLGGAVWMQTSTEPTTETEGALASKKAFEPISGAFGITLSERFQPSMVAKVLSEQEQTYTGPDDTKLKGTLYRVEPSKPDTRFQQYSLKTTDKGIIYAILGDYQYKVKQDENSSALENQDAAKQLEAKPDSDKQDQVKADETKSKGKGKGLGKPGNKPQAKTIQATCKAEVKTIAKELESRYGKPRGQGWDGLWFAFRQFSDTSNLSLRLYGHRCRTGMYSIIYTDIKLQRGIVPVKAKLSPKVKAPPADPVHADKVPVIEDVSASQTATKTEAK